MGWRVYLRKGTMGVDVAGKERGEILVANEELASIQVICGVREVLIQAGAKFRG
jgi:hypothetical protein